MSIATQVPTQIIDTFTEGITSSTKVDRENGIIRDVKLIGFESKNGRIYPPNVVRNAVHAYEGAKVNFNHPEGNDPTKPRKYEDRFGVIRNVRFVEGKGNFGDLHFNPEHPNAKQVCWDAENNSEALGFSHNALLRLGGKQSGKQVIEEIINVRSMDLVADPATTDSLFEQVETPAEVQTEMDMEALKKENEQLKADLKKLKDEMSKKSETEAVQAVQTENDQLKQELEGYKTKEKEQQLVESIDKALEAAGLDKKNPQHVSELFAKQLLATEGEQDRAALIKDRAALIGASPRSSKSNDGKPVYQPGNTETTYEQMDTKAMVRKLLSAY